HALPVQVDGAGAAVAGVTADDGAYLAQPLAQVLHQQHAGLYLVGIGGSVDSGGDAHGASSSVVDAPNGTSDRREPTAAHRVPVIAVTHLRMAGRRPYCKVTF